MFTDSHAHLTCPELWPEVEALLKRALDANVTSIINISTNDEELLLGLRLSEQQDWIKQAAALHPHDANPSNENFFNLVEKQAREGKLIAIGETGLDYHYTLSAPESQKEYLRRHFHLALQQGLPVIIHCREAFPDFFEILNREYRLGQGYGPGLLHCFTGTLEEAEEVIKCGFYISFSGIITFKKSVELREVVKKMPLERILIETDAPFLAPQSKRGKKNEPAYVPEVAAMIATLKELSLEEVALATSQNAQRLFSL